MVYVVLDMFVSQQDTKVSGIYRITINRKDLEPLYYVGQSVNIHNRKLQHLNHLRNRKCKNYRLQKAYDEYGASSFEFEILETCILDKQILANREKFHFDNQILINGKSKLLNMCVETMVSVLGIKRSEITKNKMSQSAKNRVPMSEEVRRRISETKIRLKQKPSAEHMIELANLAKGRKMSESHKEKLVAMKIGTKKSPEELARRQASRRANNGGNY